MGNPFASLRRFVTQMNGVSPTYLGRASSVFRYVSSNTPFVKVASASFMLASLKILLNSS